MSRSSGHIELTAGRGLPPDALTALREVQLAHRHLGHDFSPQAPEGLVSGIVAPVTEGGGFPPLRWLTRMGRRRKASQELMTAGAGAVPRPPNVDVRDVPPGDLPERTPGARRGRGRAPAPPGVAGPGGTVESDRDEGLPGPRSFRTRSSSGRGAAVPRPPRALVRSDPHAATPRPGLEMPGAEPDTGTAPSPSETEAAPPLSGAGAKAALPPSGADAEAVLPIVGRRAPLGPAPHGEEVPSGLRAAVEHRFGVDLSRARVHRGPESAQAAGAIDARAFAVGGQVHVPPEQGSVQSGPGMALLAHELAHAAQQRRLGPLLPAEGSPRGLALEAEARGLEREWRSPPERPRAPGGVDPFIPAGDGARGPGFIRPPETSAVSGGPLPAAPAVQRAGAAASTPSEAAAGELDFDEIAGRLYDTVRTRLRAELLVSRERAGLLTDLR